MSILCSACDNLKQPAGKGANAYIRRLREVLIKVSQITESLSSAFKCLRPSSGACNGQCVGFCFGDVNAPAFYFHERHGFFAVRA